jgi:hypothetical protein
MPIKGVIIAKPPISSRHDCRFRMKRRTVSPTIFVLLLHSCVFHAVAEGAAIYPSEIEASGVYRENPNAPGTFELQSDVPTISPDDPYRNFEYGARSRKIDAGRGPFRSGPISNGMGLRIDGDIFSGMIAGRLGDVLCDIESRTDHEFRVSASSILYQRVSARLKRLSFSEAMRIILDGTSYMLSLSEDNASYSVFILSNGDNSKPTDPVSEGELACETQAQFGEKDPSARPFRIVQKKPGGRNPD